MPPLKALATDADVHDVAALLALVGDDEDLMREIIELFLREYPRLMTGIREATATGDARALQFSAHAMKGSVGNMAAPRAYKAAMDLEASARAGLLAGAPDAVAALGRELSLLHDALVRLTPGQTP